jgi:hypothetical protein
MGDILRWPEFPKVEIDDKKIVILYENGTKQEWGIEEDLDPVDVANEINNGLRAIKFLQRSIDNIIDACNLILSEIGFSEEIRDEYLNEAFRNILLNRISYETSESEKETRLFYLR